MAAQARMLGAWIFIMNPNRSTSEDLNLTVGGVIKLNEEALRLLGGNLMTVKIEVKDDDAFADDLLMTDQTFQLGVHDTDFHCFHKGLIVSHVKLNDCEPFYEDWAEIYCKVSAKGGNVQTNAARSQNENVRVD
jgi:hypothetical protein